MGPVGVALVVSVTAYIVGVVIRRLSIIIFAIPRHVAGSHRITMARWNDARAQAKHGALVLNVPSRVNEDDLWIPVQDLLDLLRRNEWAPSWGNQPARAVMYHVLTDRELGDAKQALSDAVQAVSSTSRPDALVHYMRLSTKSVVEIPQSQKGYVAYDMPRIPIDFAAIQSRLIDLSETTGLNTERLRAEAEFRAAVAYPLIALCLIMTFQVSVAWLTTLAIPLALLMAAGELRQSWKSELVACLVARSRTEDMERLMPIVHLCRAQTENIAAAIREADWGYAAPV